MTTKATSWGGLLGELLALSVEAIVTVGPDGRIVGFNRGAEQTFGWPAGEICGRPLDLLLPARYRRSHRGAVATFLAGPCTARTMGERRPVTGVRRDGREFPAAISIVRSEAGDGCYAALVRDLSEEEAARQALEKSERRLRSAQRIAGIGYWDLDLEREELVWSEEVFRIFGVEPDAFDGSLEAFLRLVHPEERAAVEHNFRAALAGGGDYEIEHRILRPDGVERTVLERGQIERDAQGRAIFVEGIVQDVTQQKLAEERLLEARNAALAASAAKSQFLTTMGHELRTPLNAVNGFSQMLVNEVWGPLDARYHEYARLILQAGEHLTGVINTILDATRLEKGRMRLDEEPFDLGELLGAAVELLQTEARRWQAEIRILPGPDARLRADKRMLRQVLFNLVGNALKFSPRGSRVELRSERRPDGELTIAVADQGPGIDPAIVAGPVRPFVQGDNRLSRRHEGLGLGLYLVTSLVELHGGRLEFEWPRAGGTVVRVVLPAWRVSGSSASRNAGQRHQTRS